MNSLTKIHSIFHHVYGVAGVSTVAIAVASWGHPLLGTWPRTLATGFVLGASVGLISYFKYRYIPNEISSQKGPLSVRLSGWHPADFELITATDWIFMASQGDPRAFLKNTSPPDSSRAGPAKT